MDTMLVIIIGAACVGAGYVVRIILSSISRKKAGKEAKRIIEDANKQAETIKKEAQLMAKSELYEMRSKFEVERDEKSRNLQKFEQRLIQKEEILDKRMETLDKKEQDIESAEKKLDVDAKKVQEQREEVAVLRDKEIKELERIASISRDEAKELLMKKVEDDARDEAEQLAKRVKDEIMDKADVEATKIIVEAIQRTAVDTVSDHTVSVVSLPNDEMKGRIIGREGRNIRTLQQVTGVDIIIDDTPEAVTLSSFDPIRREIARLSLEKLVQDGRIHPGRIEEVVDKTRKDVERKFKEDGEKTILDLNIAHVHPDIVRLLGRLKYRTSYGQNVLQHSIEVAIIMGVMAGELKLNVELAKRIGLLHDIGKSVDFEMEGTHATIGMKIAKKNGEKDVVANAIGAHHSEVEADSPYAILVMAADALSAARPGARRESLESYIQRLEKLEEIATSFSGVDKAFAIQAGREIRIIVVPDEVDDPKASGMAKEIASKVEKEMNYPGQIKINVIREKRYIEYAK